MKLRMLLALVSLLALAITACGEETAAPADDAGEPAEDADDAGEPEDGDDGADAAGEPEDGGDGADPGDDSVTIVTLGDTEFGDVLVDGDGLTLYMFEPDEGGASTCYDDCAANWPALLAEGGVEAGAPADASLLDTIERTDGTMQVTYASHPLYYFAADSAPGDAAGQGVADVWWVVGADGEPVMDAEETSGGYGYDR